MNKGKLKEYLADNTEFMGQYSGGGDETQFLTFTNHFCDEWQLTDKFKESTIDEIVDDIDSIYNEWTLVSDRPLTEKTDCIFYAEDLRNPCNMAMGMFFPEQGFKSAGIVWSNVTHYKLSPNKPKL